MATFRKRNGKWQVQIRRTGYLPVSKSFLLKSDADVWARQREAEFDRSLAPIDKQLVTSISLKELLRRYLNEVTPHKRGYLQESYKIKQLMKSGLGNLKLTQITPQTIASYRDTRLKEVQPGTVRKELNIIGHVYEVARKQWMLAINTNPVTLINKPPNPEGRQRRLSEIECLRLRDAFKKLRNQKLVKLIEFAIETGMRRSEMTSLLWENINFYNSTLYLPTTKNGNSRTIPLDLLPVVEARELRVFPFCSAAI